MQAWILLVAAALQLAGSEAFSMSLQGPVKLVYFNLRGRGELPRLILHTAGQSFDDKPFFPEEKADYEKDLMFGQVPLLIDGDRKIVQSRTITRSSGSALPCILVSFCRWVSSPTKKQVSGHKAWVVWQWI